MELSTLLDGIDLRRLDTGPSIDSIRVCDLTEDSRTVMPGSLFVARSGDRDRGACFIREATRAGAVAVVTDDPLIEVPGGTGPAVFYTKEASRIGAILAERFYGCPGDQLVLIGVTGTNGKTTITHLAQQMVKSAYLHDTRVRCGLIGTVEVDDGRECSRAAMTTPPAIELSRTLATMVEHGCRVCSMEISSHALDQDRTVGLGIDAAGFTNFTGDHLDYHKSIESYMEAKATLFSSLGPGSVAVINIDDPAGQAMLMSCGKGVEVQRCSLKDRRADWFVQILSRSVDGMMLRINSPHGQIESKVPFFGDYNASNTLIALGLADAALAQLGMEPARRIGHFEMVMDSVSLPRGRIDRVDRSIDDIGVVVDFAHSDDSIRSCLAGVRSVLRDGASLWCVFGCGGDRDQTKRPRMGQAACSGADRVVVTSDNPRSETPTSIVEDVLAGLDASQMSKVEVQIDRALAIRFAIEHARAGDFVVVAGKGHEPDQVASDASGRLVTYAFDDFAHIREALCARRARKKAGAT